MLFLTLFSLIISPGLYVNAQLLSSQKLVSSTTLVAPTSHSFDLRSGWLGDPDTGICYWIPGRQLHWVDARSYCQSLGGKLAEPRTSTQATFLDRLFNQVNASVWIGAHDQKTECTTEWASDGSPVRSPQWMTGQPDDMDCKLNTPGNPPLGGQDCVHGLRYDPWAKVWLSSFQWDDHGCAYSKEFLCERPESISPCPYLFANYSIINPTNTPIKTTTIAPLPTKATATLKTTTTNLNTKVTAPPPTKITATLQTATAPPPTKITATLQTATAPPPTKITATFKTATAPPPTKVTAPPPTKITATLQTATAPPPTKITATFKTATAPPPTKVTATLKTATAPPPTRVTATLKTTTAPPPTKVTATFKTATAPPPTKVTATFKTATAPPPTRVTATLKTTTTPPPTKVTATATAGTAPGTRITAQSATNTQSQQAVTTAPYVGTLPYACLVCSTASALAPSILTVILVLRNMYM